ncbi:hypothetical protein RF11_14761 [Thelohanellus kitauei]|uniref:Uncharacterized protein n=1 Tax=Thelohanellus kitauei TaxID=669202 RepID=A0A0C2NJS1_THEKT|nr:hypothetical protein RF11_14761 [Thelohanellus kitauei]
MWRERFAKTPEEAFQNILIVVIESEDAHSGGRGRGELEYTFTSNISLHLATMTKTDSQNDEFARDFKFEEFKENEEEWGFYYKRFQLTIKLHSIGWGVIEDSMKRDLLVKNIGA